MQRMWIRVESKSILFDTRNFLSLLQYEEQVRKANPDIEIIGTYTGRHNPIQAKCRICGHIWSPRASSLLRGSNHKGWKTIHMNCLDKESKNIKKAKMKCQFSNNKNVCNKVSQYAPLFAPHRLLYPYDQQYPKSAENEPFQTCFRPIFIYSVQKQHFF